MVVLGPTRILEKLHDVLDDEKEDLERLWEHVDYMGHSTHNPYALENDLSFYICRGPRFGTMAYLWPKLKKWR